MPGLQGATLVELPRKLHRTLLSKRELQGRGADISESVVHTAVMGLLLVSGEVKAPGRAHPSVRPSMGRQEAARGSRCAGTGLTAVPLCPRRLITPCCWAQATSASGTWVTL